MVAASGASIRPFLADAVLCFATVRALVEAKAARVVMLTHGLETQALRAYRAAPDSNLSVRALADTRHVSI